MTNEWGIPSQPGSGVSPRIVLDTDTYNEIDDQFAVAYLLRATDKVRPEALYAAPFKNSRAESAGEGMERSFEEIERLLVRLGQNEFPRFRGSDRFLQDPRTPVESDAARDLVARAMTATHSDRLNVIAIGAITNVAAAILMEPAIVERITVTWLGGHIPGWVHNNEFNFTGDIPAAQAVFDSQVPLYVVPACPVASHLTASREELSAHMDLTDPLASFLFERFSDYGPQGVWTKEIWDISAIAWLVLPESIRSFAIPTPRVAADGSYIMDNRRHPGRFAYGLDRDAIFKDLYARLKPGS